MNQSWGTLLDSHVISYYAEDGTASTHWYAFDISAAVQAWVDGDSTITPEKGIIFKADSAVENDTAQESRTFGSFERTNHKPVFSMTYQSGITLSHSSAELYVGDTLPLTATTAPAGQAVTWHSNNAAVASVDDNGVVTGLSEGTSTITAMLADGTSAQCIVHVMGKAISLNCSSANVYKGNSVTLTATTVPAGETIEWTSLNEDIATVENGVVTGIGQGQTTIRASISQNVYADCLVNVQLQEIYINGTAEELGAGDFCLLTVTTVPAGAQVYWNSEDDSIATVTQTGRVDGIAPGQTIITASLEDGTTATYAIKVVEKQITLNYTSVDVREASPFPLIATTVPANRMVEWRSSDTEIATVSSTGLVSAKKAGKVTITASMPGGPSTTCTVYVYLETQMYRVNNLEADLMLTVRRNRVLNGTTAWIESDKSDKGNLYDLAQTWRITHVENGYYTIRPALRLNMGLYAKSSSVTNPSRTNVIIQDIGSDDYSTALPLNALWTISPTDNGYHIQNALYPELYLTPEFGNGTYGAAMYCQTPLDDPSMKWEFVAIAINPQILLFDAEETVKGVLLDRINLLRNEYKELDAMNIIVSVVSEKGFYDADDLSWETNHTEISTLYSNGDVWAKQYGTAEIVASLTIAGVKYAASYKLIVSKFRLTGYERDYEPERWNYQPVMSNTNCYSYALNCQVDNDGNLLKLIPGKAISGDYMPSSANVVKYPNMDKKTIIDYIADDVEYYGFYFMDCDSVNEIPEGAYRVALFVDPGRDFHWYRQDSDGTWSHKVGSTEVTNLDFSGEVIYDPLESDRNNIDAAVNYSQLIGYFYVVPLNRFYER